MRLHVRSLGLLVSLFKIAHCGPILADGCGSSRYPGQDDAIRRGNVIRGALDPYLDNVRVDLPLRPLRGLLECARCLEEMTEAILVTLKDVESLEERFIELRGEVDGGCYWGPIWLRHPEVLERPIGSPWSERPPVNLRQRRERIRRQNLRAFGIRERKQPARQERVLKTLCLKLREWIATRGRDAVER